ncbi:hypothetical protein, partial [Planobispora rosea]|uniref:hypothetical protein n=1 Tax=Planobispora rosea TaxID=35762 RepID=UPI001C400AAB
RLLVPTDGDLHVIHMGVFSEGTCSFFMDHPSKGLGGDGPESFDHSAGGVLLPEASGFLGSVW